MWSPKETTLRVIRFPTLQICLFFFSRSKVRTFLTGLIHVILNNKKYNKIIWIWPYLNKRESLLDVSKKLVLKNYLFENFTRMTKWDLEYLVQEIGSNTRKWDTIMRKAILITPRLKIIFQFLAMGESYKFLMYLFRMSNFLHCSRSICSFNARNERRN